jgi:hypothetical protein
MQMDNMGSLYLYFGRALDLKKKLKMATRLGLKRIFSRSFATSQEGAYTPVFSTL